MSSLHKVLEAGQTEGRPVREADRAEQPGALAPKLLASRVSVKLSEASRNITAPDATQCSGAHRRGKVPDVTRMRAEARAVPVQEGVRVCQGKPHKCWLAAQLSRAVRSPAPRGASWKGGALALGRKLPEAVH